MIHVGINTFFYPTKRMAYDHLAGTGKLLQQKKDLVEKSFFSMFW